MGSVYARLGDLMGVALLANSTELIFPRNIFQAFIANKILGGSHILMGVAHVANSTELIIPRSVSRAFITSKILGGWGGGGGGGGGDLLGVTLVANSTH